MSAIDNERTDYGDPGFSRFMRRAFLASSGHDDEDLDRPIIGIAVTTSGFNTCHRDMPALVDAVRRGVLEAGGLPLEFPTISLGEILTSPTTMLFRNLMAMETEEMIRALPMDAAVLVGGCDKTVPAQLMAAASSEKPVILEVTGPMMTGNWRGQRLGACTDCRRLWSAYRGGELDATDIKEARGNLAITSGTCAVMGTASTMACLTEILGMMLPGGATPAAATGERLTHGVVTGRRAVELARAGGPIAKDILTRDAFENAIKALAALGGSTNAIIHMTAIARRAGVSLKLDDFDSCAARTPLLVNCKPSGEYYLQDFHAAGGVRSLLKEIELQLDTSTIGVCGQSLSEILADVTPLQEWQQQVIRSFAKPLGGTGALAVLHGSLAPNGAVIKTSAATPSLLKHVGPAFVIDAGSDIPAVLDNPELDITPDHVLVLRYAGPVGSGMPESGSLPIPAKLAKQGVRDMVRVSDARMSGTSYGTVVLHCDPEASVGGPLALVRNGDLISLDVANRRIDLLVDEIEINQRSQQFVAPELPKRGWRRLHAQTILPASEGADLSFLS